MADIELPQLGESVTEGTITQWFKAVGDEVSEDEPLFEVSTDKVDSEVPSPASGYLTEILVEEGDTVDVGTKVAVLSDSPPGEGDSTGEGGAEPDEDAGEDAQSAVEPEPTDGAVPDAGDRSDDRAGDEDAQPEPEPEPKADAGGQAEPEPEPDAEPEPKADAEPGTGEREPQAEADSGGPDETPAPAAAAAEGEAVQAPKPQEPIKSAPEPAEGGSASPGRSGGAGGPVLSPVVRRLIEEAGVEASSIQGTGIGGRITRADAESYIRQHAGGAAADTATPEAPPEPEPSPADGSDRAPAEAESPASKSAPAPAPAPASPSEQRVPAGTDETVPLNKIRSITADHMVRSLQTSAHAYVSTEVDYEAVERARSAHKAAFKAEEGTSLTYLPFVARALIDALAEFPQVNASMGEERELVVHGSVHLGVAVDLDHEGLIVPVVHDAQDQRLRAVARQVADLSARARQKRLGADEITGGTVTITNIGSTANSFLLPIINQPQVMILSTDGVARRPVVVTDAHGDESIAVHSVGNLTLGWDHRAFDGAYAAQFLARLRELLETRDWESEL